MAQDITLSRNQDAIFIPIKVVTYADATATTTTQGDMGASLYRHFRAQVYVTSYTKPDGNTVASADSVWALEVSDSSNFDAANAAVYLLDTIDVPATVGTTSGRLAFVLKGSLPVTGLVRYARIKYAGGTNGAANFDGVFEAA